MLFLFLYQFALSFVKEGLSTINTIGHMFPDETILHQQTNTSVYDGLNETLVKDIRRLMNQINETLNSLKDGSNNINESLRYLADQVESIASSSDVDILNQVVCQFEQLANNYTNEVNRITSEIVKKRISEILVFKEIIVNYVPKKKTNYILRSSIKPPTKPLIQNTDFPNFTFETLRPYACKKIIFDSNVNAGNSSVTEANLLFYLKGRLFSSPVNCHISDKSSTTVKLPNPILFDKFIIQSLQRLGESDNFTIPTFHLYEPGRIKN